MRVLVTGAAGFVGFHVARRLASASSAEVVAVDAFRHGPPDTAYHALAQSSSVTRIDGDLCDPEFVGSLPEVDSIIHLAALNGTDNFYTEPWQVVRDSTLPTIHLLERYRNSSVRRWTYASSSEVYAGAVTEFGWGVPTSETVPMVFCDPSNPRWSYGLSKAHGEISTIAALQSSGVPWTILRLHNVYGPRMGTKHFIPDFIRRVLAGEFWILGAHQTRAYAYIDDVVEQILSASVTPTAVGLTLNVGSASERINRDVAEMIMDLLGVVAPLDERPPQEGSVARRCPDLSLLTTVIGPLRESPMLQGLQATVAWYRDGILADPQ